MKFFRNNFYVLLAGLCALTSCEVTHDVWLDDMEEELNYSVQSAVGKNQEVTFLASGITTPSQGVIYEWQAEGFIPAAGVGQSFKTKAPDAAGNYPVTVTAKSTGYHDQRAKKMIAVENCVPLSGSLNFTVPSVVVKNKPLTFSVNGINSNITGVSYTWNAPNFTPGSATGSTFTAECITEGTYPVSVTASAENYCDTTVTKEIQVISGVDMTGATLTMSAPTEIYAGNNVTFEAQLTPKPNDVADASITYTWVCTGCTPETYSGSQYAPVAPSKEFGVTLQANAPGYNPLKTTSYFTGKECKPMLESGKTFTLHLPPASALVAGSTVTFKTTGINNSAIPGVVSYSWSAPEFSPASSTSGPNFETTCPDKSGEYQVTVTASAPGYCQETIEPTPVTVISGNDMKTGSELTPIGIPSGPVALGDTIAVAATFEPGGSNPPQEKDITYNWSCPDCTPASYTGKGHDDPYKFITTTAGTHSIILTVRAPMFDPVATTYSFTSECKPLTGATAPHIMASRTSVVVGNQVTFDVIGINDAKAATYTWNAPEFSPASYTGKTFNTYAPTDSDTYSVAVEVAAPYYCPLEPIATSVEVKSGLNMDTGSLNVVGKIITTPDVLLGELVSLSAELDPAPASLTYKWTLERTGHAPSTHTGSTYEFTPSEEGQYTIRLTLSAPNYNAVTKSYPFTVTCRQMTGEGVTPSITITTPTPVVVGNQVTFKVEGIKSEVTAATYTWNAPSFSEESYTGPTFTTNAPAVNGAYTVTVNITATNYCPQKATKKVEVIGGLDMDAASLTVNDPPATVYLGESVKVSANLSLNTPPASLKYRWRWEDPDHTSSTYTGSSYTFTPSKEGTHKLYLTLSAPNYNPVNRDFSFTVACKPMAANNTTPPSITVNPDPTIAGKPVTFQVAGITSEAEATATYTWNAPSFSPESSSDKVFQPTAPVGNNDKTYTVSVKVAAKNYCTENIPQQVTVLAGKMMAGNIAVSSTSPIHIGQDVTFTAGGITTPSSVTYTWECVDCTPTAHTGNQYKPTAPSNAGTYTVKVTASADEYISKELNYTFAAVCMPMVFTSADKGFSVAPGTKVPKGTDITFTATPLAISGSSYTWNIDPQFAIKTGNTHTPTVTVTAPDAIKTLPVILKIEAPNYCPSTFTQTIEVAGCEEMPNTVSIGGGSSSNVLTGNQQYVFKASDAGVTTATYTWQWSPTDKFTPSTQEGQSFSTLAPFYTAGNITYTLNLEVEAPNYCKQETAASFTIAPYENVFSGNVEISINNGTRLSSVWIAQNREVTLTAHYSGAGPNEPTPADDIIYEWYVDSESNFLNSSSVTTNGTITFKPGAVKTNSSLIVILRPKNQGDDRAPKRYEFVYNVQSCQYPNDRPGLLIDENHQCKIIANNVWQAYTQDDDGTNIYRIVQMPTTEGPRWFFAENLKKLQGINNAEHISYFGVYYNKDVDNMKRTDGYYCPTGWRLPTYSEWTSLQTTPSDLGTALKSNTNNGTGTTSPTVDPRWKTSLYLGEDVYGFSILPSGYYDRLNGYADIGSTAILLSQDANDVKFQHNNSSMSTSTVSGNEYYPIRCILSTPEEE